MARKKTKNTYKIGRLVGSKGGASMMTAGAVGAIVGGALGAAGAIILADQNKRNMIAQKMYQVKDYASDAYEEYSGKVSKMNGQMLTGTKNGKRGRKTTRSKTKN